jgi:hypothetical protein
MAFIQKEQYYKYLKGECETEIRFDLASQMVLRVYNELNKEKSIVFVKEEDPLYPNAGVIEKSENSDWDIKVLVTEEMTKDLPPYSRYLCELKQVFPSEDDMVIKLKGVFFNKLEGTTI